MKNTNIKLDHANEVIRITKTFERSINQGEKKALRRLGEIKKVFPTYDVVADKITIKKEKQTYKGLTLDRMDFCIRRITNDNQAAILEFAEIKDYYRGEKAYYANVKKWFLKKYPSYDKHLLDVVESQEEAAEIAPQEQADTAA